MKRNAICLVLAMVLAMGLPAHGTQSKPCLVSVGVGELLEFSAADLERRMGLDRLEGVTVTLLPARTQGGLFLDGVEVEAYEYLDRDALDRLCFAAGEVEGTATVGLLPRAKETAQVSLNIRVMEASNSAPSLWGEAVETGRNIPVFGTLSAQDPDQDALRLVLVEPPQKGEVKLDGLSYRYDPYHNQTGDDYFLVCAVDVHGNYSAEAMVSISIDKQKRAFYYTDLVVHPSQYAALMLHDVGVWSGETIGGSHFFHPDAQLNRGRFLMLLLTASGHAETMTPTVNSGLPNDSEIPSHLKRYARKAVELGILSPDLAFAWEEIPSRAEAVVLIDRAAGISDVKHYELTLPDLEDIPLWARPSYQDLAAYQMLDLHDGFAHPARALDHATAADLLWQLYKHRHR